MKLMITYCKWANDIDTLQWVNAASVWNTSSCIEKFRRCDCLFFWDNIQGSNVITSSRCERTSPCYGSCSRFVFGKTLNQSLDQSVRVILPNLQEITNFSTCEDRNKTDIRNVVAVTLKNEWMYRIKINTLKRCVTPSSNKFRLHRLLFGSAYILE
jgi:hypothetical protein